jgi:hypothetical protein
MADTCKSNAICFEQETTKNLTNKQFHHRNLGNHTRGLEDCSLVGKSKWQTFHLIFASVHRLII